MHACVCVRARVCGVSGSMGVAGGGGGGGGGVVGGFVEKNSVRLRGERGGGGLCTNCRKNSVRLHSELFSHLCQKPSDYIRACACSQLLDTSYGDLDQYLKSHVHANKIVE